MNVNVKPEATKRTASRLAIADCDIHPVRRTPNAFDPWLSERWRNHLKTQPEVSGNLPNTSSINEDQETFPKSSSKAHSGKKNTGAFRDISPEKEAS